MKSIFLRVAMASLALGLAMAQTGCSKADKESEASNPLLSTPVPQGMVRGTVVETMNAAGYTYALVDLASEQRWLAGPAINVNPGDVVQSATGAPMANFQSRSLGRSFEVVYFVPGIENLSAPAADAPAKAQPAASQPAPAPASVDVPELTPGQDIAFLYANKEQFIENPISLRGKVVKYNDGIMGWNFIHLQDGSGSAADGNNDLTVTTKGTATVGDTVVVTGKVVLDKDFGAGYVYPLLLEDASVTVE